VKLDVFSPETIREHTAAGWWDDVTLAQRVAEHAAARPHAPAYLADDTGFTVSWRELHDDTARLAAALVSLGLERGDPLALLLPDGPTAHLAYLAAEKAGLVAIGIGPRAGTREIAHLLHETGATTLLTMRAHRGLQADALRNELVAAGASLHRHLVLDHAPGVLGLHEGDTAIALPEPTAAHAAIGGRTLGADELFFVNSTSGTTGLPKCVMHTQNRWKYFHKKCVQFRSDDVFLVVVPSPFGFGLWMAHFSPLLLGAPTVLTAEFDADATIDAIERHRVTVLAAVTTQVLMMLRSPRLATADLSSLRIVQSGGERVPYDPAHEFEQRTGAKILQFYGSNEAGCVCGTTVEDDTRHRLGTAGRIFPEMHVRLFDDDGNDTTATGIGRSACKGPGITPGYYGNDDANKKLFRDDGWMYLGDIVQIDEDGYLSVVGRTADFIIRGGHNISAPAVEEELLAHPAVAMAAVVGMPDDIVGERVCAYLVGKDGAALGLDDLTAFLAARGVSKTMWPERIVQVDELPQGSGGKVGKADLRADIARRLAEERGGTA
jgi:acyl-CoA synthetase